MHPNLENAYCEIIRLHGQEDTLTTLTAARDLGIKIRRVEQPPSSSDRAVPFKPCFFLPPKAAAHWFLFVALVLYFGFAIAPELFCVFVRAVVFVFGTLVFLGVRGGGEGEDGTDGGPRYPYMVKSLADMKGIPQPPLPKIAKKEILTANGSVMKGKYRQDQAVALHEDAKWKVTQVFEDTTYTKPHVIAEICVNSQGPTDGSFLTACEIRAILRIMKLRIEMSQYHNHACFPVLALSYIASGRGDKTEYRSGRILQAHHDGRQLVIQYSQRHDFYTAELAPASLDKFLRYYYSEPVKVGALCGMENEEPRRLLQWNRVNKQHHNLINRDDCSASEAKADRFFRRWFKKRMVLVG
ncbi:hypothetical protein BDW68DRAFT_176631 [Aspergillus falconensis]